ncbi:21311_t:CDS:2 [Entrophospora sp. SA101]|nr:21311_t:CDS:2 [Entrophospora sp. SA101]
MGEFFEVVSVPVHLSEPLKKSKEILNDFINSMLKSRAIILNSIKDLENHILGAMAASENYLVDVIFRFDGKIDE